MMRPKHSIEPKAAQTFSSGEETFLETSEADLFSRWRKEIQSLRKAQSLHERKQAELAQKN